VKRRGRYDEACNHYRSRRCLVCCVPISTPTQNRTPTPPPPLTRAPGGEPAIEFWNTWFENLANGNRVEELETGNIYSFVLDISRFSYFEKYSASVDPSVQKVVSDALERGDTKIRFTIRLFFMEIHSVSPTSNPLRLRLMLILLSFSNQRIKPLMKRWREKKNEVLSEG